LLMTMSNESGNASSLAATRFHSTTRSLLMKLCVREGSLLPGLTGQARRRRRTGSVFHPGWRVGLTSDCPPLLDAVSPTRQRRCQKSQICPAVADRTHSLLMKMSNESGNASSVAATRSHSTTRSLLMKLRVREGTFPPGLARRLPACRLPLSLHLNPMRGRSCLLSLCFHPRWRVGLTSDCAPVPDAVSPARQRGRQKSQICVASPHQPKTGIRYTLSSNLARQNHEEHGAGVDPK
jgi:hypothetical protein